MPALKYEKVLAGRSFSAVAIDLDGTLLSPQGRVTPATAAAVKKLLASGIAVIFATGRNWTESKKVLDQVGHHDVCVFVGGAMVIDTATGQTVHRQLMQPDLARDVSACLESHGQVVLALQDTQAAGTDYLATGSAQLNAHTSVWMQATASHVTRIPTLATHSHDHTVRVGIVASSAETDPIAKDIETRFADRVVMHQIRVPQHNVDVLEVFDPAATKWNGLLRAAKYKGIDSARIIAIGDDVNDLPMIRSAALGVAMGNARPQVISAAKLTIGSNAQDGLAEFLEEVALST